MRVMKSSFVLLLLLLTLSSRFVEANSVEPVKFLDLARYAGTWYEIARFPFSQQDGCHGTTATYALNSDGTIQVTNRCRKGGFEFPESVAVATAKVADTASQAKLKVKFFILAPWADYWVIRLGENYEYAVVSQPNRRYLWILSRTPHMNKASYDEIVQSLAADGFDVSRLQLTPQKWEGELTSTVSSILSRYFQLLPVCLALMTLLWVLSLYLKDASIVDRFWGLGFIALYAYALPRSLFLTFRGGVLLLLLLLWGIRLSLYIHLRNSKKGEDARYQKMRAACPEKFWWVSLFKVFWLQGAIMWCLSAPLIFVLLFPQADTVTALDFLGLSLWLVGFCFETVADFQLAAFKRKPQNAGKVCSAGLWGLSRHPNYFGEALLWWGYWLISANTTVAWGTLYSPLLMTYLLLKVSGVSLLEKQLVHTKPEYAEYVTRVPAFLPWKRRTPKN